MKEYDFYESAVVRMLNHHSFPLPWSVEETPACFVVRDRNGQALSHVYFEDNPAAKLLRREEARQVAAKVATLARTARTVRTHWRIHHPGFQLRVV